MKKKYFLSFLFLFAFLVRTLVFQCYLGKEKNYWQVDSNTYHNIAKSIAQGDGISTHGKPNFYRLPGYSLFLSIFYKFFGVSTKSVLWVQIFFASFIPVLVFFLSLTLFPSCILLAKIAAFYSSIHLGLVLYSGFFMTESLFIIFLLLFWLLFFKEKYLFLSGMFLGIATLIRPVGHYLIVLAIIMLLCSQSVFKSKIKNIFILCLGWLFIVFWWLLRNFLITGYIFFHTLPGGHFLYFSASRVAMHVQKCSYWQARENLRKEVEDIFEQKKRYLGRKLSEIEQCYIREEVAIKYFKKYPFLAIKNWATDILRTSFSLYASELVYLDSGRTGIDYFAKGRTLWAMFSRFLFPKVENKWLIPLIYLEILLFVLILVGFVFGFIQSFSSIYLHTWLRVLPFMVLFIIIGLSGGYNRMRLPIEPLLIILSFSWWVNCVRYSKK